MMVDETSEHRIYKHIKTFFGYEKYLNNCSNDTRRCLTKIRLSSHAFLVERGRWGRDRIDYIERKCTLCDCVEDEFHCLLECPRFNEERKGCLPVCLKNKPSMYSFVKFLSSENPSDCDRAAILCKRVKYAYRKQKKILIFFKCH